MAQDDDLLSPSDAARVLGISADRVRDLADTGVLPVLRTTTGRRLFRLSDVERLRVVRAAFRRNRAKRWPAIRPSRR